MSYIERLKNTVEDKLSTKNVAIAVGVASVAGLGLFLYLRKAPRHFAVVLTNRVPVSDIKSLKGGYKLLEFQMPETTSLYKLPKPLQSLFRPENGLFMARLRSKVDLLLLTEETGCTQTDIDQFVTHSMAPRINIACITLRQLNGRGRGEHTWSSTGNNLFMTFAFSLDTQYSQLCVCLAVATVIHALIVRMGKAKYISIKWPNDIVIGDSKVAGVLCETSPNLADPNFANFKVGVGINVEQNGEFRGLKEILALDNTQGLRERLACEVLSDFFDLLAQKSPSELTQYVATYINDNLYQKGKTLVVNDLVGNPETTLTIKEVRREDFNLVGQDSQGQRFAIHCEGDSLSADPTQTRLTKLD